MNQDVHMRVVNRFCSSAITVHSHPDITMVLKRLITVRRRPDKTMVLKRLT